MMKFTEQVAKCLTAVFILLFFVPDYSRATIVLVSFTRERLVVAADSRESRGKGFTDHFCKIVDLAPRTFFFATGRAIANDPSSGSQLWTAQGVAKQSVDSNGLVQKQHPVSGMIEAWSKLMKKRYQDSLSDKHSAVLQGLTDSTITQGIFGDASGPELRMCRIALRYSIQHKGTKPLILTETQEDHASDTSPIFPFGDPEAVSLATEFFANQTERAKIANRLLAKESQQVGALDMATSSLKAAIDFAIQWTSNKSVGGPVDLLILERGKTVRWIHNKPECESPTNKN